MIANNPIYSVNGNTNIPCPSSYEWSLQDISASTAGRTEDTVMHKERIGQAVKIQLSWNNITTAQASTILNAFNPEYIGVKYLDPKLGGYTASEITFYVGDRSAPMYNSKMGLWSNVSFNIIERSGVR